MVALLVDAGGREATLYATYHVLYDPVLVSKQTTTSLIDTSFLKNYSHPRAYRTVIIIHRSIQCSTDTLQEHISTQIKSKTYSEMKFLNFALSASLASLGQSFAPILTNNVKNGQSTTARNMFTGIVEEMGTVVKLEERDDMTLWDGSKGKGTELTVQGDVVLDGAYLG